MPILAGGNVIEGAGLGDPLLFSGVPSNGTTEVQTLTQGATGGTFTLTFKGFTTAPIAWNATAAAIDTALENLPSIGPGGVICAGGPLNTTPVTVTFSGPLVKQDQPMLVVNNALLTGGTLVPTASTPGVDATYPSSPIGAKLIDMTNGVDYINTTAPPNPTWVKTGTQT